MSVESGKDGVKADCPLAGARRDFLAESWFWLRWLAGAVLLYPALVFIGHKAPKQPRLIKVHRLVPAGGFLIEHDFILFNGQAGPWAVSRKCTHLGCRLNFQEKEGVLLCPCHSSRFSREGLRLSGPAKKNLPLFRVALLNDGKGYEVAL